MTDIDEDMELLQPLLAQMVFRANRWTVSSIPPRVRRSKKVWKARAVPCGCRTCCLLATGRLDDESRDDDRRLKDLAAMLHPYTRDGTYGKYFGVRRHHRLQRRLHRRNWRS